MRRVGGAVYLAELLFLQEEDETEPCLDLHNEHKVRFRKILTRN